VRRPALLAIAALLPVWVLGASLTACSSDGGDGAATEDTDDRGSGGSAGPLSLSSPAFDEGEPIPEEFSLAGGDTSPPLTWSGVPPDTAELALTVVDPDAGNFVHWVVVGLDPSLSAIEEGELPDGAVQAMNNFDEASWGGPAPPPGAAHTYVFTLFALGEASGIAEGSPGNDAVAQLTDAGAETAVLRATFEQR
jgi:hypothetical protein